MRTPTRKIMLRKLNDLMRRNNKLTLRSKIATPITLVSLKLRLQVFSDSKQARVMMKRILEGESLAMITSSEVVAEDAVTEVASEAVLVEVISVEAEEIDVVAMVIVKKDVAAMETAVTDVVVTMEVRIAMTRVYLAPKASSMMLMSSLHCEDLLDTQSIMDDWNRVNTS